CLSGFFFQPTGKRTPINTATQPDRVAGSNCSRMGECRREIPRRVQSPVVGWTSSGMDIVLPSFRMGSRCHGSVVDTNNISETQDQDNSPALMSYGDHGSSMCWFQGRISMMTKELSKEETFLIIRFTGAWL